MQTSGELKTQANIYSLLNLWGGPTLALSDWYPWCCEGGNINTTSQNSSPCSHLDRCVPSWGSHQQPHSHKGVQIASLHLLSVRGMERDGYWCLSQSCSLGTEREWSPNIGDQKLERRWKRQTQTEKEGAYRDLNGCAGLKVLQK